MSGEALFDVATSPATSAGPGPVRAGVDETIKRLEALDLVEPSRSRRPSRQAGLIAQARSIAGSIDRESGEDASRKQASGVSLAALHERLADLLDRLDPAQEARDPASDAWEELSRNLSALPPSPVQVEP